MQRTVLALAFVLLAGAPDLLAQTGNNPNSQPSQGRLIEAPIGHRQPRANEVPSEKNLSNPDLPANKEDAALDRKLRSICRGC